MIGNVVGRRRHRLITYLGISLAAASAAVMLTGTPAHAAFISQGTFRIVGPTGCLEVPGNATADGTHVAVGTCDGGNNERWTIFLLTDQNNYQIEAYAGDFSLNKCLDGPDSFPQITIFGCHGGHQQRWTLPISTTAPQQIRQAGTNECASVVRIGDFFEVDQVGCSLASSWSLVPA